MIDRRRFLLSAAATAAAAAFPGSVTLSIKITSTVRPDLRAFYDRAVAEVIRRESAIWLYGNPMVEGRAFGLQCLDAEYSESKIIALPDVQQKVVVL